MDKLSKDMKACAKAGFGVSYGKWKATQPIKDAPKPKPTGTRRVCKNCGKEFIDQRKGREKVFCDEDCRMIYSKRNLVWEPVMKNCEWCGKTFEARRANHRFCSKSCSALESYYRRKELDPE